jgi:hypothetical protein
MLTADININEFNRSLNRITTNLRVEPKKVFVKEVGELIKTLVRLSPPKNLATAKRKASKDIRNVYRMPPYDMFKGKKIGRKDIRWLYASPVALVGVKNYNFNENYTVADAKQRMYEVSGTLGKVYKRIGTRGKGSVHKVVQQLNRKIITRQVFRGVEKKLANNFGRQKAAWMVATAKGQIPLSGGNMPPAWVKKHVAGVFKHRRGDTVNGLNTPNNPSFTLINRAVGVEKSAAIASAAVVSHSSMAICRSPDSSPGNWAR